MIKQFFRRKWVKLLAIVFAALAGTWAAGAVRDTYEVAKMTEKMKTICVGRMLIDLPAQATTELYGAEIDGFGIEAYAESPEAFRTRVAAREAELRAKPDQLGGNKNLEAAPDVKTDSGLVGKIFVHGRNVEESTAGYSVETFRHLRYEGVDLEAHVHGDGISIELSAKDYDPDHIENLSKLVAQLVANPGNRIPTDPGFCVDRAFVRDPLNAEQGERIVLAAGLPRRPDIEIRFDTLAGTKPDSKGLLERNAASHARAPAIVNLRFTNLRAAPRTIGGLTGDELVERVVEENFSVIFGFQWEVIGTEDNVFVPDVNLRMATGRSQDGPVQSSLSEPAALALWDKISSSVRVRPTAPPKVSVAAPISPPLGTLASAGDACPQSGWWRCGDGGNEFGVLGGEHQYIKQGQRMPQALLLSPQTLWEKLRGVQPTFESKTPTTWALKDKRRHKRIAATVPLAQPIAAPSAVAASASGRQAQVGTYASTGIPCPASGWWRCEETHALDGTRWFTQGNLLPPATFAVPASILSGSQGIPKAIQRRAGWRLVRAASASGPESGDRAS